MTDRRLQFKDDEDDKLSPLSRHNPKEYIPSPTSEERKQAAQRSKKTIQSTHNAYSRNKRAAAAASAGIATPNNASALVWAVKGGTEMK
mmetsp:Transcript_10940/g.20966  ORF Transcript_10940/g.20966 Transcript_10940/m.20966 type:complete len:89 (-) Transcript_10940:181-447(-)|eukprot:scaffold2069_cov187-Amphora_coffeaeformis.AAC.44